MSETINISREDAIRGYEACLSELVETAKYHTDSAQRDWPSYGESVRQELEEAQTVITEALHCIGHLEALGALKSDCWED